MKKRIVIFALLTMLGAGAAAAYWWQAQRDYQPLAFWKPSDETNSAVIDHSAWQDVLDEYLVSDDPSGVNLVDYEYLAEEGRSELSSYLTEMTSLDPRSFNRAEQFAYWVNLYNALTLKVIIDSYPASSILKISEKTIAVGPWNDVVANIADTDVTLNDIEHRILRPYWQDYRIHFAVNCASIGCPNVQARAFTSANTEDLLDSAADEFINHPRGVFIGDNGVTLSSIFEWYQEDFGNNEEEMLATLEDYMDEEQYARILALKDRIDYQYDWSLNDVQ
ncbi:MAG: DUF547 domain-containing protein [Pseudomonadota bacterium]